MNALYEWVRPEGVLAFFAIVGRVSGIFLVAPLFSNRAVPARVKIALIIMTSLILYPLVSGTALNVASKANDLTVLVLLLNEISIGLVLGYIASLVFASLQMLGEIFGMQLGLGIATIFDPANEGSAGVMTIMYVILGSLIFLSINGHHMILAGLVRSFDIIPVGKGFNLLNLMSVTTFVTKVFVVAIQICIPILVVTTVVSVVFGFMTKLSPSMGIYFNVGFIITPVVGILVVIVSIPLFRVLFTQLSAGLEGDLVTALKGMKGL